jgi:hypothetical protein
MKSRITLLVLVAEIVIISTLHARKAKSPQQDEQQFVKQESPVQKEQRPLVPLHADNFSKLTVNSH